MYIVLTEVNKKAIVVRLTVSSVRSEQSPNSIKYTSNKPNTF